MKRKHIPGGCYCCGCEEIDVATLPTIEIPGYTFLSWGGSPCCKCAAFAPEDTDWIETCSDVFASVEEVESVEYEQVAAITPIPRLANGSAPCPIPPEYCCFSGPVTISTHSAEKTKQLTYKLLMLHKPYRIYVCFSHQLVTCEGEEPVLKWIVSVRKEFVVNIYATEGRYSSLVHEGQVLHDCFEESELQPCSFNCNHEQDPACTFEDLRLGEGGNDCNLLLTPIHGFDRVKFFDELPNTQEIFTSDDTPEDCTWEYCETEPEYDTQVCFSQSSYHACFPDCVCLQTYPAEIVEESVYAGSPGQCGCNSCVGLGVGVGFTVFIGVDCDFVFNSCCGCTEVDSAGNYACPDMTINRLRVPSVFLNGLVQIADPSECPDGIDDSIQFEDSICPSTFPTAGFNLRGDYFYVDAALCATRAFCDIENCDTNCCHSFVCSGNNQVISCEPKFTWIGTNWLSYERSIECNLYPQSLCINFGNVTVNFS